MVTEFAHLLCNRGGLEVVSLSHCACWPFIHKYRTAAAQSPAAVFFSPARAHAAAGLF